MVMQTRVNHLMSSRSVRRCNFGDFFVNHAQLVVFGFFSPSLRAQWRLLTAHVMWCPSSDPFALKRNVARSLNSQMVFEYIQERFRTAYRYFACPQSRNGRGATRASRARARGAHAGEAKRGEEEDGSNSTDEDEEEEEDDEDEDEAGDEERRVSRGLSRLLVEDEDEDRIRHSSSPTPSPHNGLFPDSDEEERDEEGRKGPEQHSIAPEDLHYTFDRMIFTGGKVLGGNLLSNACYATARVNSPFTSSGVIVS